MCISLSSLSKCSFTTIKDDIYGDMPLTTLDHDIYGAMFTPT